jgi:outer membrane protein
MIALLVALTALEPAPTNASSPGSTARSATQGGALPAITRQVRQDTTRFTLDQAVARALASYPTLAASKARADGAAADLGVARAEWLPHISADASLNRFQYPMVVAPLHGFDITNPPQFDRTLIQPQLSFSWTLFDLSRISRVHVRQALGGAAAAGVTRAEAQLLTQVVNGYLRVLTARDELAAEDERLKALTAELQRAQQMLAQGKAARVDVLRVDAEARRAWADRIASAAQLDVAEHQLAQLTGLSYGVVHGDALAGLALADTSFAADTSGATRDSLVQQALRASPAILQLRDQVRAAGAGLAAARAAWVPQLRVGGAYVDYGSSTGAFSPQWQVGVAISYPLFTGGGRVSAVHRAAADDRAVSAELQAAELGAAQGVDQALAALREARARVAALESAVAQSEEVANIERLSLDVGSGTETDYLDAEAKLLSARAGLIEARHAEISARVELARATGELSRDWLAHAVETVQ